MINSVCTDAQIPVLGWGIPIFYDSSVVELSFSFLLCSVTPLGSSYLVGRVLSIVLQNSLSLTVMPFLIYFHCFSAQELLFL